MIKPVVGIISSDGNIENGSYKKKIHFVNDDYINIIYKCGGIPIIIPNTNQLNELKDFLDSIDALLLIGGPDISKECYLNKKSKNSRDNFEIKIYNYFKKKNKPILGICRGLQIINVAEGGTLKNIDGNKIRHVIETDGWVNYHEIIIKNGTKLRTMLSRDDYSISSAHHQAIDKLGKSLVVSAVANDGCIEAIEHDSKRFIIAFQGHIEKCNNYSEYIKVIRNFIEEASFEKR